MRLKDWGKGLNLDQPSWELAPGYWNNVQNARFRNGKAERVGGIASIQTPSIAPYAMGTFQVGGTATVTRYTVNVGLTKVYTWDGSSEREITRGIAGAIGSLSGSGTEVTITTGSAHGLTTGDNVIVSNVVPTGYNTGVAGAAITVLTATTFKYSNATVAAVTQNGIWESNRTSNFTYSAGEEISLFALNGVLYVNTIRDGLYFWNGSTSSGAQGRLRRVCASAQAFVYGRVARPYKDYVMVLGYVASTAADSTAVTRSPFTIAWGASAEPGSIPTTFTAASTNDAGSVQKTKGIQVDGFEWQGTFYSFSERGVLAVEWIGGNDVMRTDRWTAEASGLLAPNCLISIDAGQFFISQNYDFMVHRGGAPDSIAEGRISQWVKDNISTSNAGRSYLAHNKKFNEIWFCIPTSGNTTPNKAFIYNYKDDTWGQRDLPSNCTCATNGLLPTSITTDDRMLVATTTPAVAMVDSGTQDLGASYTTTLERTGMDMDSNEYKLLSRSKPMFDGSSAFTCSIYHGAAATQDASPTYASAATYTHNTSTWVNAFSTSAPFLAYKITSTASDTWSLRSIELDVKVQGGF